MCIRDSHRARRGEAAGRRGRLHGKGGHDGIELGEHFVLRGGDALPHLAHVALQCAHPLGEREIVLGVALGELDDRVARRDRDCVQAHRLGLVGVGEVLLDKALAVGGRGVRYRRRLEELVGAAEVVGALVLPRH
eukprot:382447-Prymnesium_polylepis.3